MCSLPSLCCPQSTWSGNTEKQDGTGSSVFVSQPLGKGNFRGLLPRAGAGVGCAENLGWCREPSPALTCALLSHSSTETELAHPNGHPLQVCNSTVVSKFAKWFRHPHSLILERFRDGNRTSSLLVCVVCPHCWRRVSPWQRMTPHVGCSVPCQVLCSGTLQGLGAVSAATWAAPVISCHIQPWTRRRGHLIYLPSWGKWWPPKDVSMSQSPAPGSVTESGKWVSR